MELLSYIAMYPILILWISTDSHRKNGRRAWTSPRFEGLREDQDENHPHEESWLLGVGAHTSITYNANGKSWTNMASAKKMFQPLVFFETSNIWVCIFIYIWNIICKIKKPGRANNSKNRKEQKLLKLDHANNMPFLKPLIKICVLQQGNSCRRWGLGRFCFSVKGKDASLFMGNKSSSDSMM